MKSGAERQAAYRARGLAARAKEVALRKVCIEGIALAEVGLALAQARGDDDLEELYLRMIITLEDGLEDA